MRLYHKYRKARRAEYESVCQLFIEYWPKLTQAALDGTGSIDPTPLVVACREAFGSVGLDIVVDKLQAIDRGMRLSPRSGLRYLEWASRVPLADLFNGSHVPPEVGRFIDQRFIDYLQGNEGRIQEMHWRKLEELTAEFFHREGFEVNLGPGSNDDGVDVRVWKPDDGEARKALLIIQCKRQKAKVEKVVVKSLHADLQYEGAEYGLVVTASELSPGARTVITTRGCPIREVSRDGLATWLRRLRTPGSGIVRI